MKTGFIGIGSMGDMLVRALLRSGALAAEDVWAANRSPARVDALADTVSRGCDIVNAAPSLVR